MAGAEQADLDRRRPIPPNGPWHEEHRIVALLASAEGPLRVAFQIGYHRLAAERPEAVFVAAILGWGARPVAIAAPDLDVPARGWEVRGPGIWADHISETTAVHWSYGLEAFGVAIDDPVELLDRGFGDRVALGWELDFESSADVPAGGGEPAAGRWWSGELHGLVLIGRDRIEVAGPALRSHRWGEGAHPSSTAGRAGDEGSVALPTPDGVWWIPSLTGDRASA